MAALITEPGLCRQRDAIVDAALNADLLMFFDDDFFPDRSYIAMVEAHMRRHLTTMVATGQVLADGINGPGLSAAAARKILGDRAAQTRGTAKPMFSGYGCNMAVRIKPLRDRGLRFDERLQLYCWQEDVDRSRRLAAFGDIILRKALAVCIRRQARTEPRFQARLLADCKSAVSGQQAVRLSDLRRSDAHRSQHGQEHCPCSLA